MAKNKKIQVDKILNKPIYFDKETSKFNVEIGESKFESESLERLKLDVKESHITEIEEEVYYDSSGDLISTKVVKVTPDYVHLSRYRAGMGINPTLHKEDFFKDIFPINEKNKKIFKKNQELRDKGWNLIHKAEELIQDMDVFPKDYFHKKMLNTQNQNKENEVDKND